MSLHGDYFCFCNAIIWLFGDYIQVTVSWADDNSRFCYGSYNQHKVSRCFLARNSPNHFKTACNMFVDKNHVARHGTWVAHGDWKQPTALNTAINISFDSPRFSEMEIVHLSDVPFNSMINRSKCPAALMSFDRWFGTLRHHDSAYIYVRADSRFAPSQWKTPLQSNGVSHWLRANLKSALYLSVGWIIIGSRNGL